MRVLLVEDNEDHALLVREVLAGTGEVAVDLVRADSLTRAFGCLAEGGIDVVLLDLSLPDSKGLDTVLTMNQQAPGVPFVVLTVLEDEGVGLQAIQHGAQDYLVKSQMEGNLLRRTLRYAIERKHAEAAFQEQNRILQAVVDSMVEGLVVTDRHGNIVLFNTGAAQIFGIGATDTTPGQWAGRYGLYLPDTLTPYPTEQLPVVRALRGEVVPGVELFLRNVQRAEGAWLRATATPLKDSTGGIQGGVCVFRDITEHKQAEKQKAQIRAAQAIQERLFPARVPHLPGYDIGAAAYPAEATSGDYYDFIPLADGGLGLVLGDVSGHGLGAALLMAETRACLRALAHTHSDPGEILTIANAMLSMASQDSQFVTLFFGLLDPARASLLYASAGHRAYLLPPAGAVQCLDATGPPLGSSRDLVVPCAEEISLDPGHILLLVTDGAWEARSAGDQLFGIRRVVETVQFYGRNPAGRLVENLFRTIRNFSNYMPQEDDITAIIVKVDGNEKVGRLS
jgi:CheY-like chemotaxis protein